MGLFVPIPSTCSAVAVVPWRAPLLIGGALMSTVLMLIVVPLQGDVVDYGLGGERARASGGVEIVVVLVISFQVS